MRSLLETLSSLSILADDVLCAHPSHDPRRAAQLSVIIADIQEVYAGNKIAVAASLMRAVALREMILDPPRVHSWAMVAGMLRAMAQQELESVKVGGKIVQFGTR